jgi:transposase
MSYLQFGKTTSSSGKVHHYIWECTAYRDAKGKPTCKKKRIGTFDPVQGQAHISEEYLKRVELKEVPPLKLPSGINLASIDVSERAVYTKADVENAFTKEYGLFYLLVELSKKIGLEDSLIMSLPNKWQEIFMLVVYLVSCGDPFLECEEWLESTTSYKIGEMSTQKISNLLKSITEEERNEFYTQWCSKRQKEEYLALDITSSSSYSELIDDVEWGHNRDKEKLAQVNICMLMGETSMLPIYQMNYPGSVNDVKTLKTTIDTIKALLDFQNLSLVMDKGFYSTKNIDYILKIPNKIKFIISIPFRCNLALEQINKWKNSIQDEDNCIIINDTILYSVSDTYDWDNNNKLNIFTFFNENKYIYEKTKIMYDALNLLNEAKKKPIEYVKSKEHLKYLDFKIKNDNTCDVFLSKNKISTKLKHSGWFIILTNDNITSFDSITIYRNKDVVEKGFLRLKQKLDLYRTRVHSQIALDNKIFISFIALILVSKIHYVMIKNDLYKKFTMKQLISKLKRVKIITIKEDKILKCMTKSQNDIFEAFDIPPPKM